MHPLTEQFYRDRILSRAEFATLLSQYQPEDAAYLAKRAQEACQNLYGNDIYVRGLIECTSYCERDCFYCGIRHSNHKAARYRLTPTEILACCETGYRLGFRTFVLQGGEDAAFTPKMIAQTVKTIKERYPDTAVTLSFGEQTAATYQLWFDSGADRYLLRHETASPEHYRKLHPPGRTLQSRLFCLHTLQTIGYQVGMGFLVGSPFQTADDLAQDLLLIHSFAPQMVGIGPFIPHRDTPFARFPAGSLQLTLFLLSLLRLMQGNLLLPATTALGTIHPHGREQGILAGANVVMPNLSPVSVRKKYELYNGKLCTGEEAAECQEDLKKRLASIGYRLAHGRGDPAGFDPAAHRQKGA